MEQTAIFLVASIYLLVVLYLLQMQIVALSVIFHNIYARTGLFYSTLYF